jgi:hypothetical protein
VLVSDAAREAAGRPEHIEFGPRRLHWLKNVPQPVDARSAACKEPPVARRSLRGLAKQVREHAGGVAVRYTEATG